MNKENVSLALLKLCAAIVVCLGIYEGLYEILDGHSFVRAYYAADMDSAALTKVFEENQ